MNNEQRFGVDQYTHNHEIPFSCPVSSVPLLTLRRDKI